MGPVLTVIALLEATRATIAGRHPLVARTVLVAFRHPWMLRPILAGARVCRATGISRLLSRLPGPLGFAMAMLDQPSPMPTSAMRAGGLACSRA